jgi:hypothetical protein
MKKSRFTESQIAFALKQAETGTKVDEICRQMGVFQANFFFTTERKSMAVWGSQSYVSFDSLKRKMLS